MKSFEVKAWIGMVGAMALALCIGATRASAGCGDGVVDGSEVCDPPGAACTNPTTLTAGTCSSSCTCDLPQCSDDCDARCNDVRNQCENEAGKLRGVQKKACSIGEKNSKQLCDETEVTSTLACSAFCPGSPEYQQCRSSAGTNRRACKDLAKTARDTCKANADQIEIAVKAACDAARQQCEALCP